MRLKCLLFTLVLLSQTACVGRASSHAVDAGHDAGVDGGVDAGLPAMAFGAVNAGAILFDPTKLNPFLDQWSQAGMTGIHILAYSRDFCLQCGASLPQKLDIDTEPTDGSFDFSGYFTVLDGIVNKGLSVVLSLGLSGAFESDLTNATYGNRAVLPPFVTIDDTMICRGNTGLDSPYAATIGGSPIRFPRFASPRVRARILAFVDAVVSQFQSRYGSRMIAFDFPFNATWETEYPFGPAPFICDTSPESLSEFQSWLATRYATPAALATAWNHSPAFTSFQDAQILDGQPPPPVGKAPQAYLDFAAYREASLASFLGDIRDHIHAAGGRTLVQYGSVFDVLSAQRGTYGFGKQVSGADLILEDDAPTYDHAYSIDVLRTNAHGIALGAELDSPCLVDCHADGGTAQCCQASVFPTGNDVSAGNASMAAEVSAGYAGGARYVGFANWDAFSPVAFASYPVPLRTAATLAALPIRSPLTVAVQTLSLRELYVHHEDSAYLTTLLAIHAQLSDGGTQPVSVEVVDDL